MPVPTPIDAHPNPWKVNEEFLKTVLTLAGILLGLTVTFASQLIGKAPPHAFNAMYVAWGLCILTIGAGVIAHGLIVNYLKTGNNGGLSAFCANVSLYALLASTLAFAVAGWIAVSTNTNTDAVTPQAAVTLVEKAIDAMPGYTGDKTAKWNLKSLTFDASKSVYDIVVVKVGSTDTWTVTLNTKGETLKVSP